MLALAIQCHPRYINVLLAVLQPRGWGYSIGHLPTKCFDISRGRANMQQAQYWLRKPPIRSTPSPKPHPHPPPSSQTPTHTPTPYPDHYHHRQPPPPPPPPHILPPHFYLPIPLLIGYLFIGQTTKYAHRHQKPELYWRPLKLPLPGFMIYILRNSGARSAIKHTQKK